MTRGSTDGLERLCHLSKPNQGTPLHITVSFARCSIPRGTLVLLDDRQSGDENLVFSQRCSNRLRHRDSFVSSAERDSEDRTNRRSLFVHRALLRRPVVASLGTGALKIHPAANGSSPPWHARRETRRAATISPVSVRISLPRNPPTQSVAKCNVFGPRPGSHCYNSGFNLPNPDLQGDSPRRRIAVGPRPDCNAVFHI